MLPTPIPESELPVLTAKLAEGAEHFSRGDRFRLWQGLAGRAFGLWGAVSLAVSLWERLSVEFPDNLAIHHRRFDFALQADNEEAVQRIYEEIRRVNGAGGSSSRMAKSLHLIWRARHGDPSGLAEACNHWLNW